MDFFVENCGEVRASWMPQIWFGLAESMEKIKDEKSSILFISNILEFIVSDENASFWVEHPTLGSSTDSALPACRLR